MATSWTAYRNGNWSTPSGTSSSPWYGGSQITLNSIPQPGDSVAVGNYTITWDSGALAIPATGSLQALTFGSGSISQASDSGARSLSVTNAVTGGSNSTGAITLTGACNTTLNFAAGFTAGTAMGINNTNGNQSGATSLVINGNVSGGSTAAAYGYSAGGTNVDNCTIHGIVKGGTNATAYGVYNAYAGGD